MDEKPGLKSILPDVSRETVEDLRHYVTALEKWNTKINLVSAATLADIWTRHVADSAQLFGYIPDTATILLDIGSGGGFPGLVLAVLSKRDRPDLSVVLMDSDKRKCEFLRSVSHSLNLKVRVVAERIDTAATINADVMTARALAPVSDLLGYGDRHMNRLGTALFLKGGRADQELAEAEVRWSFDCTRIPSATSPESYILMMESIRAR